MTITNNAEPESAVERTLVARGWSDIDRVERLGQSGTARAEATIIETERERARQWYSRPVTDTVPSSAVEMYESTSGLVRYRRVVDHLTEGERVFEVGIGMGFLATMMLKDGRVSRYRGVDLVDDNVVQTRAMLRANGFDGVADAATGDLYEVTRQDLEDVGATLLVCCEVIEHVPDPEEALATLARALPDGTDLLFSVPLLGRLEGIWGHVQNFGAARIREMLGRAGLVAHHVEPLHNTWALVLASRSPSPSPRAKAVLESGAPFDPERLVEAPFRSMTNRPVRDLDRVDSEWTKRVSDLAVEPVHAYGDAEDAPSALRVTARARPILRGPGRGWPSTAGVAFRVPDGTKGVRLELAVPEPESVEAVKVEFRRGDERTGLWAWKPAERRPKTNRPTFVILPERTGTFMQRTPGSSIDDADTVEVYAQVRGEQGIDFAVRRWAWIG